MLPSELHLDNVSLGLGDPEEGGLGHLQVLLGEVAPVAVVVSEAEVGGAEVGRRHHHGGAAPQAIEDVVHAPELVAAAAGAASAEQRAAQAGRVPPVPEYVQVPVPASAATFGVSSSHCVRQQHFISFYVT